MTDQGNARDDLEPGALKVGRGGILARTVHYPWQRETMMQSHACAASCHLELRQTRKWARRGEEELRLSEGWGEALHGAGHSPGKALADPNLMP